MLKKFRSAIFPVGVVLFLGALIGCGGGGSGSFNGTTATGASATGTTATGSSATGTSATGGGASFKLMANVIELDKGSTKVTGVAADSVTLTGAGPLSAGNIIIHNATDGTNFVRKVVSSTTSAGVTTVRTTSAGVEDVFETANIAQSNPIPASELAKLVPAQEGVSFVLAAKPGTRGGGGINVQFSKMLLKDDSGNPICQIDGTMNLDAGIETRFNKSFFSVNEFRAAPYVNASGTLTARGRIGGSFSKEFPIS